MSKRLEFVRGVREIAAEKPAYCIGGDGRNGTCDCVGLVIGALRRMGIPYKGEHSSNWLPRREAVELWEIERVDRLTVGDVVLKARGPGDAGYSLPERFRGGRDALDYYHAGVVTGTDPLEITHMTTPTVQRDTRLGRWTHAMLLRQLQDKEGETVDRPDVRVLYPAEVVTERDDLRIRAQPVDGEVIGHAEKGSIVDVLEEGAWPKIRAGGVIGYACGDFLRRIGEDEIEEITATTFVEKKTGQMITLLGDWSTAED